jgi:uncharacterized protein (TIGR02217 family)
MAAPVPTFPLTPTPFTLGTFNVGPTLAWSLIKTAHWATRMQRSTSGREVRVADFAFPIWDYTLTWEVLRDAWDIRDPATGYGQGPAFPIGYSPMYELDNIVQFFNSVHGAHMAFQWNDPTDNDTDPHGSSTDTGGGSPVTLGVGDGTTKVFRIIGHQGSPVSPTLVRFVNPGDISYVVDYDNGLLVFSSSIPDGITVQISMSYNQRVRFKTDSLEAEEFMYQLWTIKKLELTSVMF